MLPEALLFRFGLIDLQRSNNTFSHYPAYPQNRTALLSYSRYSIPCHNLSTCLILTIITINNNYYNPINLKLTTDMLESIQLLKFDNSFVRELPADPIPDNYRRQVYGAFYSKVAPTKVAQPKLAACSPEVGQLLDLTNEACISSLFTEVFSGNTLLPDMDPYAMCYGGHQFGSWAGQLGDGRAINLGEVINQKGERWVLQLKGSGPTPYSRRADGLAVLRSSIREFLCSEAMYHLGVPTTRALSLVTTGEMVERDMFYDGHPEEEIGAIVCRVSPSFIRFGNFEIFASRNELKQLKQLVDYTLLTDFPHLGTPSGESYLQWFTEVCRRTAEMIVHWMRVGFVHGVMNTDNMSILGLTIDYGPYGWIDNYDPNWTPNTTDAQGKRYGFGNQPYIGLWNLTQLANAIAPLVEETKALQDILEKDYRQHFQNGWHTMMAHKLGFKEYNSLADDPLFNELLEILTLVETDMTLFYRQLARIDFSRPLADSSNNIPAPLLPSYYSPDQLSDEYKSRLISWLLLYQHRTKNQNYSQQERQTLMDKTNPLYVLRNYLAQEAIDMAESGDYSRIAELLDILKSPYKEQTGKEHFKKKRPEWARHRPGCSMLS